MHDCQVEAMLDQQLTEVKKFIDKVSTLPRPSRIDLKRLGRVVELVRVPGHFFQLKVKSAFWALWLKFGVLLIKPASASSMESWWVRRAAWT